MFSQVQKSKIWPTLPTVTQKPKLVLTRVESELVVVGKVVGLWVLFPTIPSTSKYDVPVGRYAQNTKHVSCSFLLCPPVSDSPKEIKTGINLCRIRVCRSWKSFISSSLVSNGTKHVKNGHSNEKIWSKHQTDVMLSCFHAHFCLCHFLTPATHKIWKYIKYKVRSIHCQESTEIFSNLFELSIRSYKHFGSLFHIKWLFSVIKWLLKNIFSKFKNSQILNNGFKHGSLSIQKENNTKSQTKDPLAIQNGDFSNPKSL